MYSGLTVRAHAISGAVPCVTHTAVDKIRCHPAGVKDRVRPRIGRFFIQASSGIEDGRVRSVESILEFLLQDSSDIVNDLL